MKLSEWAKNRGITYRTAWNWVKSGKMPVSVLRTETGTILVDESKPSKLLESNVVIYARVSNHSRKKELDYQVKRCEDFCISRGYTVLKTYKEVASGMNDKRKGLWRAINSKPSIIVVEHKDRLTRFGFEYLENLLIRLGTKVIVINEDKEDQQDLVKDLVSIIYSFCSRLYGLRRAKNKAKQMEEILIK